MRGILDTSIFVAEEQGRPLATDRLPEEGAISVVTLAELELGVHLATPHTRGARLGTLQAVHRTYVALPIDDDVASAFAALVAQAREAGRRPKVQDCWIAATARAHDATVYTRDGDFDALDVPAVRV